MAHEEFFAAIAGHSIEGREIIVLANFDPAAPPPSGITILIGGQHGDEPATVSLLESFHDIAGPVAILARANPDGLAAGTRTNARGVDPNRNFDFHWSPDSMEPPGPHPWSEPETCALRDWILAFRPAKIVSLHWALAEIDADGPQSTPLANAMWAALTPEQQTIYRLRVFPGDEVSEKTEVACPGSLGQWCGFGLRYPDGSAPAMVTLELPYDPSARRPDELADDHLETVRRLWATAPERYLRDTAPAVHAMLAAACRHEISSRV